MILSLRNDSLKIHILLASLFLTTFLFGQLVNTNYWTSISFDKKVFKKTRANIKFSYRSENQLVNNQFFFQGGIERKVKKKRKIGFNYRYTNYSDFEFNTFYIYRPSIYYCKGYKIKKMKLDFRSKIQIEKENQIKIENTDLWNSAWRNKLKLSKKIAKKWKCQFYTEWFSFEKSSIISRYRIGLGMKYEIKKKFNLSVRTIYQSKFDFRKRNLIFALNLNKSF